MNKVAIIDYDMCNLDSVSRAVEECGGHPVITDQKRDIETASRVILPGVGAFPDAMHNIKERSLDQILQEHVVEKQIPSLGICLGMQLLSSASLEFTETEGLGFIPGIVHRLEPSGVDNRIPHIGWNEVHMTGESPLFNGVAPGKDFYFVHSYHFSPDNQIDIVATTPYGNGFVSAVQHEHIYGVQFHPEKSQRVGFQVLKNFLSL